MQTIDFVGEGVVKVRGKTCFLGAAVRYKSRLGVGLELLAAVLLVLSIAWVLS